MRVLLDECLPRQIKRLLENHLCSTTSEMGWAGKTNGELLRLAENEFDVFLTVDRNIPRQQNIARFQIAIVIVVTKDNAIKSFRPLVPQILEAIEAARPGHVTQVG